MSYKEGGLYDKYTVTNNKTGEVVDGPTFVLRPDKDLNAALALMIYGAVVEDENQHLALGIAQALDEVIDTFTDPKYEDLFVNKVFTMRDFVEFMINQGSDEQVKEEVQH
jgi:hypothetical protein